MCSEMNCALPMGAPKIIMLLSLDLFFNADGNSCNASKLSQNNSHLDKLRFKPNSGPISSRVDRTSWILAGSPPTTTSSRNA